MRKRAIEIERERNLKMVGEIVVEVLRKMEKVRREETRLEMKEIKEEIRRLMRLEKANEMQEIVRREFKEPCRPMEVDEKAVSSEKVYNMRIKHNTEVSIVRNEVMEFESNERYESEKDRRRKVIGEINAEKDEERKYKLISSEKVRESEREQRNSRNKKEKETRGRA